MAKSVRPAPTVVLVLLAFLAGLILPVALVLSLPQHPCNTIPDGEQDVYWSRHAIQEGNLSLCDNVQWPYNQCKLAVGNSLAEQGRCDQLAGEQLDRCNLVRAVRSRDPAQCANVTNTQTRDDCLFNFLVDANQACVTTPDCLTQRLEILQATCPLITNTRLKEFCGKFANLTWFASGQ